MKINPRVLPAWAWVFVLLTPAVLILSLLWFAMNQSLQVAAMVQIVAKASEAGLLEQPDIRALAQTAFSGSASFTVLCASIAAVGLVMFIIIFTARRNSSNQHAN